MMLNKYTMLHDESNDICFMKYILVNFKIKLIKLNIL
jgi:hypothetical protein